MNVTRFSIFSTVQPDYGLLLELQALTQAARSYALLLGEVGEVEACRCGWLASFPVLHYSYRRLQYEQCVIRTASEVSDWSHLSEHNACVCKATF